jgi:Asp/Glu/hydantoin racemase
MIRIAFVVGDYPPEERKRREDAAKAYASAEVEVGIVSVPATPYIHDLSPAEIQLVAPPFIEAYREAERQGYDAVVPLGTLDLGVEGGRSAVDIPVIAPTEAMLHVASLVGDRFGIMVYHKKMFPLTQPIVSRYRMSDRVVGWRATGFDLPDMAANHDKVVSQFVAQARSLIEEDGADVILPMGISQCPVHIKPDWLTEQLGVPVVEAIGAPIRFAAMMASLKLKHSRKRWPRSPSFPAAAPSRAA